MNSSTLIRVHELIIRSEDYWMTRYIRYTNNALKVCTDRKKNLGNPFPTMWVRLRYHSYYIESGFILASSGFL
jgi:hypothetical protein